MNESVLAFCSGFTIFSVNLLAIVFLSKLSVNAAANGAWDRSKTPVFMFLLTVKVILVVGLLAYLLISLQLPAMPLFIGSLASLLIFVLVFAAKRLFEGASNTQSR